MTESFAKLWPRALHRHTATVSVFPLAMISVLVEYDLRLAALTALAAGSVLLTRLRYAVGTASAVMCLPLVLRLITHASILNVLPVLLPALPASLAALLCSRSAPSPNTEQAPEPTRRSA